LKDPALLEKKLGLAFIDRGLLMEALTHRSFLNENRGWPYPHNERIEFLGDAVIEMVVTQYLFETYPDRTEGDMTAVRVALVNGQMLAEVSRGLGIEEFIFMSQGELKDTGRARTYILCAAFEALLGALYMDQGWKAVQAFLKRVLLSRTEGLIDAGAHRDPKSAFQAKAQEQYQTTPTYRVLEETGPDHDKHFVCGAFIGEELVAKGRGAKKQEAETDAAKQALKVKGWS